MERVRIPRYFQLIVLSFTFPSVNVDAFVRFKVKLTPPALLLSMSCPSIYVKQSIYIFTSTPAEFELREYAPENSRRSLLAYCTYYPVAFPVAPFVFLSHQVVCYILRLTVRLTVGIIQRISSCSCCSYSRKSVAKMLYLLDHRWPRRYHRLGVQLRIGSEKLERSLRHIHKLIGVSHEVKSSVEHVIWCSMSVSTAMTRKQGLLYR